MPPATMGMGLLAANAQTGGGGGGSLFGPDAASAPSPQPPLMSHQPYSSLGISPYASGSASSLAAVPAVVHVVPHAFGESSSAVQPSALSLGATQQPLMRRRLTV